MKKAVYTFLVRVSCVISFASCKKEYHCQCTYNNAVVYTKDLGNQTSDNAKKMCSSYDSTGIPGEVWLCTVY
jgi:hypothetical protein